MAVNVTGRNERLKITLFICVRPSEKVGSFVDCVMCFIDGSHCYCLK